MNDYNQFEYDKFKYLSYALKRLLKHIRYCMEISINNGLLSIYFSVILFLLQFQVDITHRDTNSSTYLPTFNYFLETSANIISPFGEINLTPKSCCRDNFVNICHITPAEYSTLLVKTSLQ